MKTIELSHPHTLKQSDLPETIGAIGFFDGIHRGHQKVIKKAVKQAQQHQMESAVVTFHPHPSVILQPKGEHIQYITPLQEKQAVLKQLNVDKLYIITFDQALSLLSPAEFIKEFIVGLNIKHLIAGFDFTYGYQGKGTMENIHEYGRDAFTTTTIPKVEENGEKISSTLIRKLIKSGRMIEANHLLGRSYQLRGTVVSGDKRGRTIGFPTANLKISDQVLLPKLGVYAVQVMHDNKWYEGMANVGVKPTFGASDQATIEIHIFDYSNDLYGEELVVKWYEYIREEQTFKGVKYIVEQLNKDEETIRTYFGSLSTK